MIRHMSCAVGEHDLCPAQAPRDVPGGLRCDCPCHQPPPIGAARGRRWLKAAVFVGVIASCLQMAVIEDLEQRLADALSRLGEQHRV